MNNDQTIEKLKQMRLDAVADLHHQHVKDNRIDDITADEYLALMTDHQWEDRQNKKIDRLFKQATFREKASSIPLTMYRVICHYVSPIFVPRLYVVN